MKKGFFSLSLAVAALGALPAHAATTITAYTASAPNVFGSPSYPGWVGNAISALVAGTSSAGTAGTPQFAQLSGAGGGNYTYSTSSIVTGFASWQGVADLAVPFASELGNRMLFPLKISSDTPISISQLAFSATGTGVGVGLNFGFAAGSYNYSLDYQGVLKGTDGILWTNDDVFVTSGPNTTLVDGIVGRGSGNSFAVYSTDPGATNQDKINNFVATYGLDTEAFDFTGTYSLGDAAGSATAHYNSVPDAGGTLGLMGLALCGMMFVSKKMRRA